MYQVHFTGQFKKDLKLIKKRSVNDFESLRQLVKVIESGGHSAISAKHRPHILRANFAKHWECHVLPDLIIIWLQNDTDKSVTLIRAGSHTDLF